MARSWNFSLRSRWRASRGGRRRFFPSESALSIPGQADVSSGSSRGSARSARSVTMSPQRALEALGVGPAVVSADPVFTIDPPASKGEGGCRGTRQRAAVVPQGRRRSRALGGISRRPRRCAVSRGRGQSNRVRRPVSPAGRACGRRSPVGHGAGGGGTAHLIVRHLDRAPRARGRLEPRRGDALPRPTRCGRRGASGDSDCVRTESDCPGRRALDSRARAR